jgi:hypothetical protein
MTEPTIGQFTQTEQILAMLRNGPVCGTVFLARHIGRYGARLADLKAEGVEWDKRPCDNEAHRHRSRQWEYFLTSEHDGRLF